MRCPDCGYDGIRSVRCRDGNMDTATGELCQVAGEHVHLTCMRCGWAGLARAVLGGMTVEGQALGVQQ